MTEEQLRVAASKRLERDGKVYSTPIEVTLGSTPFPRTVIKRL